MNNVLGYAATAAVPGVKILESTKIKILRKKYALEMCQHLTSGELALR